MYYIYKLKHFKKILRQDCKYKFYNILNFMIYLFILENIGQFNNKKYYKSNFNYKKYVYIYR
jgi:hypothetical protein